MKWSWSSIQKPFMQHNAATEWLEVVFDRLGILRERKWRKRADSLDVWSLLLRPCCALFSEAGACKVQAGRLSGGMKRKLSLGRSMLQCPRAHRKGTSPHFPHLSNTLSTLSSQLFLPSNGSTFYSCLVVNLQFNDVKYCKVINLNLCGSCELFRDEGIAFLGGSRLVVLDEPTSGLDCHARNLWTEKSISLKKSLRKA